MALSGKWQESQEKTIKLPTDHPTVFAVYQRWAYFNELPTSSLDGSGTREMSEYEALVGAYVLGEKLMDGDFKDAVIDGVIGKLRTESTFNVQLTRAVYDGTYSGCAFRRLWLDIYYHSGTASWLDESLHDIHPEFLAEYDASQRHRSAGFGIRDAEYMSDTCVYHEHRDGSCFRQKLRGLLRQQTEFGKILAQYTAPVVPVPSPEHTDWVNLPVQSGIGPLASIVGDGQPAGAQHIAQDRFMAPLRASGHSSAAHTPVTQQSTCQTAAGTATVETLVPVLVGRNEVQSDTKIVLDQLARLQRQLDELESNTRALPSLDDILRGVGAIIRDYVDRVDHSDDRPDSH